MSRRDWSFIGRRPRHQAAIEVAVVRAGGGEAVPLTAELVDLSRHGARLRAEMALAEDEPITIFLSKESTGLDLAFPGAVRWRSREEASRWVYGCQFNEEVPLETLGELFLAGILSVQPPTSSG
jgi:hypothetical protein